MRKLIIYYSRTGENYTKEGIKNLEKGNTQIVAETIKKLTGADIFEIEPVKDYPNNYRKCCEIAKEEFDKNARPKLKKYLSTIDDYDVIYIGYPIWCGTCPMVIFSQLEKLNFTNKIVKPFSTHEGSKLANSINNLKKYCKGADIKPGIAIRGSDVKNSELELKNWI